MEDLHKNSKRAFREMLVYIGVKMLNDLLLSMAKHTHFLVLNLL